MDECDEVPLSTFLPLIPSSHAHWVLGILCYCRIVFDVGDSQALRKVTFSRKKLFSAVQITESRMSGQAAWLTKMVIDECASDEGRKAVVDDIVGGLVWGDIVRRGETGNGNDGDDGDDSIDGNDVHTLDEDGGDYQDGVSFMDEKSTPQKELTNHQPTPTPETKHAINSGSLSLLADLPSTFCSIYVASDLLSIFSSRGDGMSLQSLVDVLQAAGEEEEGGGMQLEDERYDDVLSVRVVRNFIEGVVEGLEGK